MAFPLTNRVGTLYRVAYDKMSQDNNRRIAKNTLLLYVRMLFMMAVTLYTSRIILNTLGVEDYGIYNVVGGIVSMFGFINGSMSSATQRYITFALGRGDKQRLSTVFSTSLQIHTLIAGIIVLIGETVGVWFLYEKMQIPPERMDAARGVALQVQGAIQQFVGNFQTA